MSSAPATHTGKTSMDSIIGTIKKNGGMSMSNLYEARFNFDASKNAKLMSDLKGAGFSDLTNARDTAYSALTLFCEEASLPGMMANTGQTTGVYMGEGQVNYAHTKSFTDISLGWTCDANLLPLKFVNTWLKFIFDGPADAILGTYGSERGKDYGSARINRVQYPDDYQCELKITKAERNKDDTLGRIGGIYTLHDVYPYSIQSTPLSYGSSTLLKVSASFYYRRWSFDPYRIITP